MEVNVKKIKSLLMGKAASSLLIITPLGGLEERDACH